MTDPEGTSRAQSSVEPKEITDPRELRALTHPVRLSLLEVLATQGPLTATEAGELIGESSTTCSFHFRQLAKYGFVEESGTGTGRNRPWRLVHLGMTFSDSSQGGAGKSDETAIAATALSELFVSRVFDRFSQWRRVRHSLPAPWQEACGVSESVMYVTPEELRDLRREMTALFARHHDRLLDPRSRPDEARCIEVFAAAYPARFGRAAADWAGEAAGSAGVAPGAKDGGQE